jgi:hypothetical protein
LATTISRVQVKSSILTRKEECHPGSSILSRYRIIYDWDRLTYENLFKVEETPKELEELAIFLEEGKELEDLHPTKEIS